MAVPAGRRLRTERYMKHGMQVSRVPRRTAEQSPRLEGRILAR